MKWPFSAKTTTNIAAMLVLLAGVITGNFYGGGVTEEDLTAGNYVTKGQVEEMLDDYVLADDLDLDAYVLDTELPGKIATATADLVDNNALTAAVSGFLTEDQINALLTAMPQADELDAVWWNLCYICNYLGIPLYSTSYANCGGY